MHFSKYPYTCGRGASKKQKMINTITTKQVDLQWLIVNYHTAGIICKAQFLQTIKSPT